jgi:hypothetical protein
MGIIQILRATESKGLVEGGEQESKTLFWLEKAMQSS